MGSRRLDLGCDCRRVAKLEHLVVGSDHQPVALRGDPHGPVEGTEMGIQLAVLGAQKHHLPGLVGRYRHAQPTLFEKRQKAVGELALERLARILANAPGQALTAIFSASARALSSSVSPAVPAVDSSDMLVDSHAVQSSTIPDQQLSPNRPLREIPDAITQDKE